MQRRDFLNYCRSAGLATTLFPGVLWAQIQPGTKKITLEMVRESARLAGLDWTDADCQDVTDSLSSLARGAEGINKSTSIRIRLASRRRRRPRRSFGSSPRRK